MGRIINSFDIIVRLNRSLPIKRELYNDIGSRTDILYNSLNRYDNPGENITSEHFLLRNNIKFLCTSYPNIDPFDIDIKYYLDNSSLRLPFKIINEVLFNKIENSINTRPNTGIMAILDLLNTDLNMLYITGINFYKTNYYKSYVKNKNIMVPYNPYSNIHNQNIQINLLKYIVLNDNRVRLDGVLKSILFSHYIRFFKDKSKIDNDNIFKLNNDNNDNIFLNNNYEKIIFIGNISKKITINNYDLIICMNSDNIETTSNIPIITVNGNNLDNNIIGVINLKNIYVPEKISCYKCGQKYYKKLITLLKNIHIYTFNIEFYLILCLLYYFPKMKFKYININESSNEYNLLKYIIYAQ